MIRSLIHKDLYAQILWIVLSFALMIVLNYLLTHKLEHDHLKREAENDIFHMQSGIEFELLENEVVLSGIAETARIMISQHKSYEMLSEYIKNVTKYMTTDEKFASYVINIYGVFEAFDGKLIFGNDWVPPKNYMPAESPWHEAAMRAGKEVRITEPYVDTLTGAIIITYVRRIFDEKGNRLGIICLDINLAKIKEYISKIYIAETEVGILLSEKLNIVVHPDSTLLGKSLRDVGYGIASLAEELEQGVEVSERRILNYRDEESVAFFKRLKNNWYVGILIPEENYYKEIKNITIILSLLGIVLAAILIILLLKIEKAKESAEQSIKVLTNVLNGLDMMIYVTDTSTNKILFINENMKKHYGLDDAIGKICYKVFQKGMDRKCDFCPCYQLDKEPHNTVIWEERSTLTDRVYRNTDRYIEWHDGKIVHIQHSEDVTELVVARELAEQSSRFKNRFLSRISHEIRTPMATIMGITEMQLQNETIEQDMKKVFIEIYNTSYLLLDVISNILDVYKIEANKIEIAFVEYDVASLINDIVQFNIMRMKNKAVEFEFIVDENLPVMLFGDVIHIKQILNNLLSNAFKYTESGKVKLSVSAENTKKENFDVILILSVSDTGQGMTEEQKNKIFDEYSHFSYLIEGTGLGMNITQYLIKAMKGEVTVNTELGKGTEFIVRLPQKSTHSGVLGKELVENLQNFRYISYAQMRSARIEREPMPYGNVLVVDDVESNLYVAKGLLQPYKLTIDTADSGAEAVEKIKKGRSYDIIFMDHMMPEMDGVETVKAIRELGYTNPIIALTANVIGGQAELFLKNGFDGFIAKPINIHQMNSVLNKFIRDRQSPEVIGEVRRQYALSKISTRDTNFKMSSTMELAFARDAKKKLLVLESISNNINAATEDDLKSFAINANALKSVLANVGERALSKAAHELEKAGLEGNRKIISSDTPAFLDSLSEIIQKIDSNDDTNVFDDEDTAYLRTKLLELRYACTAYDKKLAKNILSEIYSKRWSRQTKELLSTLSELLLHSDFEEVIKRMERFL
jgi:signal transduction histidine kinase/CheY-like chemotaxis protein/HPt (histidine-containing phosphotransfer) domain-containing protein